MSCSITEQPIHEDLLNVHMNNDIADREMNNTEQTDRIPRADFTPLPW